METLYYQAFSITGVANTETLDTTGISPNGAGLTSTQETVKTLKSILVSFSGRAGNFLVIAIGQRTPVIIPDYVLGTYAASGTDQYPHIAGPLTEVPVNIDIQVGETLYVGIRCGATNKNIIGSYVYTVKG
jgi:hypothetical protein